MVALKVGSDVNPAGFSQEVSGSRDADLSPQPLRRGEVVAKWMGAPATDVRLCASGLEPCRRWDHRSRLLRRDAFPVARVTNTQAAATHC
jgi:hypothetical protein